MSTFEFSAGVLCLDFANTWGDRSDPADDKLSGFEDLIGWACQGGVVNLEENGALSALAQKRPSDAKNVFAQSVAFRETIFRILSITAAGRQPGKADLEVLNRALAEAPRQSLEIGGECCRWTWTSEKHDLRRIIWPVILSAAELMTSEDVSRVSECAAPDCSWLFLDTSKGRRRRWCDMGTCGNRAKARRYYERHNRRE